MDHEIDLFRYLLILLRRWHWIVLAAVISAATAIIITQMQPSTYTATSSVFLRPAQSTVAFDPRYVSGGITDLASRTQGLLTIAQSTNIETQIPVDVRERLASGKTEIGVLTNMIEVKAKGDLFLISATASTAEQARELADTWAKTFVSYASRLYGNSGVSSDIDAQVAAAEERYRVAQAAWEQFLGSTPSDELAQRIAALEGVLSDTLVVEQIRYSSYLSRTLELSFVLRDAEMLKGQLQAGRPTKLGETLAALSLRARTIGGMNLPIQLQITQDTSLADQPTGTLDDVNLLIDALHTQIAGLQSEGAELGAALASKALPSDSSLTIEQRTAFYNELLSLRQQREVEEGKRRELVQQRDVTLEALQVVRRKVAEEQVTQGQSTSELKLASEAVLPVGSDSRRTWLKALAGGLAGGLLGACLVMLAELTGLQISAPRRRVGVDGAVNSPSS